MINLRANNTAEFHKTLKSDRSTFQMDRYVHKTGKLINNEFGVHILVVFCVVNFTKIHKIPCVQTVCEPIFYALITNLQ